MNTRNQRDDMSGSHPEYWPLFFTEPQLAEETIQFVGYAKKVAPGILTVTDLSEVENVFFDRSGHLEAALHMDCQNTIRKIITH